MEERRPWIRQVGLPGLYFRDGWYRPGDAAFHREFEDSGCSIATRFSSARCCAWIGKHTLAIEPLPEAACFELPKLPEGWLLTRLAALHDGKLAMLTVPEGRTGRARRKKAGKSGEQSSQAHIASDAQIFGYDGHALTLEASLTLTEVDPRFDYLGEGLWVIADSASEGVNARIFDKSGRTRARLRLGQGIKHMKASAGGQIWVGWRDLGVFANEDWQVPDLYGSPSARGLAAFDKGGDILALAEASPEHDEIVDCYALSVSGDTAFACVYTDFSLVACSAGGGTRWWSNDLDAIRALAVHYPYALALGGYPKDLGRITLLELGDRRAQPLAQWRLDFVDAAPEKVQLMQGCGATLHLVFNGEWYDWRVSNFLDLHRRK